MEIDFLTALTKHLARGFLPGREAQRQFEPGLCFGRHFGPPTYRARPAAVVALLYRTGQGWHLPLTVRPTTLRGHAGQISLPGGVVEPAEASETAALREMEEELGVDRGGVRLLGRLSPLYVFVSEFQIWPWVAVAAETPSFRPSPDEVSELLEIPLAHLLDPASRGMHGRRQRGIDLSAPHFIWGRHRIWGATAMILSELAAVLVESGGAPPASISMAHHRSSRHRSSRHEGGK